MFRFLFRNAVCYASPSTFKQLKVIQSTNENKSLILVDRLVVHCVVRVAREFPCWLFRFANHFSRKMQQSFRGILKHSCSINYRKVCLICLCLQVFVSRAQRDRKLIIFMPLIETNSAVWCLNEPLRFLFPYNAAKAIMNDCEWRKHIK